MQINICFYNFFFFTVFHVFPGVNCEVEGEKFRRLCWSNSISNIIKKIRSGRKQKRPWFLAERKGRHHTRAIVVHNLTKWSRPKKNTFLADMSAAEIPIFHDITKVFWQVLTSTHCKKFWNFFAYSCISENNTRMTETRTNKVRIPTKRENKSFYFVVCIYLHIICFGDECIFQYPFASLPWWQSYLQSNYCSIVHRPNSTLNKN